MKEIEQCSEFEVNEVVSTAIGKEFSIGKTQKEVWDFLSHPPPFSKMTKTPLETMNRHTSKGVLGFYRGPV